MADNGISRIYQFLASFGTQDGQAGWVEKADCKKQDGVITKAEFRQFINENWNGEESLSDDLINQFWSKVDTNKSAKVAGSKLSNKNALDKNEQQSMLKRIEVYDAINNIMANDVTTSVDVGDITDWKKSIRESLEAKVDDILKSNQEDFYTYIKEEILPGVIRITTADKCATTYINASINVPNYQYDNDGTLKTIINKYVESVRNADVEDSEIQETVHKIVDAYIATTTEEGPDEEQLALLEQYGYKISSTSSLNGLQKAMVENSIKEALKGVEQEADYNDYKDIYDAAVTKFINSKLNGAKYDQFSELLAVEYSQFTASAEYKGVKNKIAATKFLSSTELADAITAKYGERVANTVIKDGNYVEAVKNIRNAVLEKIEKGEFLSGDGIDTAKIQEYVLAELGKHLADLYKGDLSKMSLTELETMYDSMRFAAEQESDATKQLQGIINAAKKYCEGVSKKSTTLANAVTEILGGSYSTVFNDMLPSEIDAKIDEIKAKVGEIGDVADFKGKLPDNAWGTLPNSVVVNSDAQKVFKIASTLTIDGRTIDSDRITYKSSNTGIATTDDNGNVTFKGASGKVKISIMIDNVEVGTKEVHVTTPEATSVIISRAANADTLIRNDNAKYDSNIWENPITGQKVLMALQEGYHSSGSFKDLYNNDGFFTVFGRYDDDDWNTRGQDDSDSKTHARAKASVLEGLLIAGRQVVDVLKTAGLNETTLTQAMQNVSNRYANTLDNSNNNSISWDDESEISNHKEIDDADNQEEIYEYMKQTRNENAHKVVHCFDTGGSNDSNIFAIYFKDFVDDIIAEYYALGGK